jgi:hypothetical protein
MTPLVLAAHLLIASPQPTQSDWYGWEPLFADCTATLLFAGAGIAASDRNLGPVATPTLLIAGFGLYLIGGPAMHWRRDRFDTALVDLAVRVVAPLVGALGGFVMNASSGAFGAASLGLLLGGIVAVGADAAVVSWEPPPQVEPQRPFVRWMPVIGAARGGPVAGIAGTF